MSDTETRTPGKPARVSRDENTGPIGAAQERRQWLRIEFHTPTGRFMQGMLCPPHMGDLILFDGVYYRVGEVIHVSSMAYSKHVQREIQVHKIRVLLEAIPADNEQWGVDYVQERLNRYQKQREAAEAEQEAAKTAEKESSVSANNDEKSSESEKPAAKTTKAKVSSVAA